MYVAWDTETERFGPGKQAPPLVCVSYCYEKGRGLVGCREAEELLEEMFYNDEAILIGHNIAYDLAVVAAKYPRFLRQIFQMYAEGRIRDTMIRQKLMDIAIGRFRGYQVARTDAEMAKAKKGTKQYRTVSYKYTLDDCNFRATKKRLDKETWRLRYGELKGIPVENWPEDARKYPVEDAVATWDVFHWQEKMNAEIKKRLTSIKTHLIDPDPLVDEQNQCRAAWWIQLMKTWGIRTSPERVYQVEDFVDEAEAKLIGLLQQHGLVTPAGKKSIKAAQARMVKVMGGKDKCKLTDKGGVKTDEEACIASGDGILMDYAALVSLRNVRSKDVPALIQGCVMPIHSNFAELIATGRTSSSKPNIQNIRQLPGIRECFMPRAGKVFLDADYDGLELRTLAQVCLKLVGKSKLAEDLNSGKDPHLQVAATLLKIPYADAEIRLLQGDEAVENARQLGKIANFGFPGGLGFETFIYFAQKRGRTVTEHEARKLKAQWFKTYPEMELYFALIDKYCQEDREDNQAFIQHLFSKRLRGDIGYTVACNSHFQGLGADATKAAGFLIAYACYVDKNSPLYGCRVVNYIHDQFIVECDEAKGHEAAMELARLMELGAAPWLPDVPPKVSKPVVARCWSKKAKQVWVNGRLVPWDMPFGVKNRDKRKSAA